MGFWETHGIFIGVVLGLCLAFIPRITTFFLMLLTSFASGGFFWWMGWLFLPHFLVAGLATLKYWDTNPILVILAWAWALVGTGGEIRLVKTSSSSAEKNPSRTGHRNYF